VRLDDPTVESRVIRELGGDGGWQFALALARE
jgi:hypothetical protein